MDLAKCLSRISHKYPCRNQQIEELYEAVGNTDEPFPPAVSVYGHACTGKSVIISSLLRYIKVPHAVVNCTECFSSKILFESVIDELNNHQLSAENGYSSFRKCDSMGDFIAELRKVEAESIVIVLENAEYLRDINPLILSGLLKLQEFSGLNICCVLVSQIHFGKFYPQSGLTEVMRIKFPQYSANEVGKILQKDYESIKKFVERQIEKKILDPRERSRRMAIINSLDMEFFTNYLHAFLCVFFRACRNVSQLRMVAKECYEKYCEPIFEDDSNRTNITKLWHNVSDTLKKALSTIYSRIEAGSGAEILSQQTNSLKQIIQIIELPFYAKYLLIAGFLSSHNPASQDKRLFMKNHGKQRKRMQQINAKAKVSEQTSLQQGPKSFTIDRLLAIFHAILDQRVTLTCNLMAQISSLVQLNFFVYVTNETNVVEGSARLQCFLTYEFATQIGEMVGFNLRQYLYDLI